MRDQARGIAQHDDVLVLHVTESKGSGRKVSGPTGEKQMRIVCEESDDGYSVVRVSWQDGRGPAAGRRTAALMAALGGLRRRGFRPDVVHAQIGSASLPALLAARRLSVPLVVTEQWSRLMDLDPRLLSRQQRLRARFVYTHADAVLAVGSELRSAIKHFAPRARVLVVPNPVDTEVFHPSLRPSAPPSEPRRLVNIGRLVDYKGVQHLLAAVRILADGGRAVRLDVIGEGPARSDLEKLAVRLGLEHTVVFHGQRTKESFAGLVAAADACVVPGDFETFCVAGAEALACGTPVVATMCGGPQDYVTRLTGRLVPPRNPEAMAAAIAEVLDRSDIAAPRDIAEQTARRFSIPAVGRQLHDIYSQLSTR
ncbi:glycosyltransferase [Streptomyces antimycoticus]|uniref:glycosyltransferase n=1 Tax=Streptomyces antimycoticus TaxID=68175 RepID=UPI0022AB4128|nr:glycosyltransferase [Streptomyces antimycoticus]